MRPGRRRFEHLVVELSLAVDVAVPRFGLWLALHEHGADPERLRRADVLAFCEDGLEAFLAERGLALPPGERRRLARRLARFDARHPTPEERLAAFPG